MKTITIRGVTDEVYARLAEAARRDFRPVSMYVLVSAVEASKGVEMDAPAELPWQRLEREKREHAERYARQAEKHARQPVAYVGPKVKPKSLLGLAEEQRARDGKGPQTEEDVMAEMAAQVAAERGQR